MNKIFCLIILLFSSPAIAQTAAEKPKILYGSISKDSLTATPFNKWFNIGYDNYHPEETILSSLKKQGFENIRISIFFGTWCGDSKREVPRFLKLLSEVSFTVKNVQLIAVGNGDSLVKQSPQHEEAGLGIFRVPVFIIYKNGKEINRINEFPVLSLEKDLQNILGGEAYIPNYHSFGLIRGWLEDGSLSDENTSPAGLAEQLRSLVGGEHELNSLGYLLLKQDRKKEALRIFQVNYHLYPKSANILSSLGEGYYENGDNKKAVSFLERALELNKEPQDVKGILEVLYKAKEKEISK
ncbi:MAG: hypothetical protein ABIR30_08420 [Chitinophagaceae bacterium]